jgi:hypothetical protein
MINSNRIGNPHHSKQYRCFFGLLHVRTATCGIGLWHLVRFIFRWPQFAQVAVTLEKKSIRTHQSLPYTFQNLQMLNLLAITLLAVIVKNPSMMQNMNSAIENYDDVKLAEA